MRPGHSGRVFFPKESARTALADCRSVVPQALKLLPQEAADFHQREIKGSCKKLKFVGEIVEGVAEMLDGDILGLQTTANSLTVSCRCTKEGFIRSPSLNALVSHVMADFHCHNRS